MRHLPLILLVVIVVGGIVTWTAGTDAFIQYVDRITSTPPKPISPGVNAALVVAWLALVGLVVATVNVLRVVSHRAPVVVAVPERLYSFLAGATALGLGLLIGTSIFR